VNWIYKLTKGELVDRMEQHHLPSDGTITQLRHRLVHFVRENDTLFPECLKEPSGDDYKEDLEPSMAELDLGERPGEYQAKTTEKRTPKDVPKEQGEYPGKQTSNIQPEVNYENHLEHERYEESR
jgi:hypothetical protein